jgi:hypothetical protein
MADHANSGARTPSSVPETTPAPGAVREQLERLLVSPLFQRSKRCAPFLRYIVLETLQGRNSELKERRIGADVFQRHSFYDTGADPIVRTTAVEVRKRLAQYYQDPARGQETRIELVAGHYVPQFRLPNATPLESNGRTETLADSAVTQAPLPPAAEQPPQPDGQYPRRFRFIWLWVMVAAVVVGGALVVWSIRPDPVDAFWSPIWSSRDPISVVIGDALDGVFKDGAPVAENTRDTRVGFVDSIVQARVAGILDLHGRRYEIRLAGSTTLSDLRRAPAVLVGAFNNVWTMRFQGQLRFAIAKNGSQMCIEDRQKPEASFCNSDIDTPYSKRDVDYAVVARFLDATSRQQVLMLAGLGGGATRAAGEFVTQAAHLKTLAERAPHDWGRKNLEVVIAVALVNGNTGPPRIVATQFW